MISDIELRNTIFTDVMTTIQSLSAVVRHDIQQVFDQAKPAKPIHQIMASTILNPGVVTREALDFLVEESKVNKNIDIKTIREILVRLKVAFPLADVGLFIPCLLSDKNRISFSILFNQTFL